MNNKKRFLVTAILILVLMALVYSGYKILARSTNEMLSEGDGLPSGFPYITYEDRKSTRLNSSHVKWIP